MCVREDVRGRDRERDGKKEINKEEVEIKKRESVCERE